ncbi:hypothetical protein PV326_006868, partial [Microctonus aethiopoides]
LVSKDSVVSRSQDLAQEKGGSVVYLYAKLLIQKHCVYQILVTLGLVALKKH